MSKLQSNKEEYAKNQRADTIYRIITNKQKSPSSNSKRNSKDRQTDKKLIDTPKIKNASSLLPRTSEGKAKTKISPKKDLSLESLRKDIIDKKKILLSDLPDDIIKIFCII